MEDNKLSSKEDWKTHWKEFQIGDIKYIRFDNITTDFPTGGTFIEVGGFPGLYSAWFNKKFGYNPTLLDFFVKNEIISRVEETNGLKPGTIEVIEADFFSFETDKKYDVVFSWGFIEHFNDIQDVVDRHYRLLSKNGHLLIGLPNFKGISGFFTRLVDKEFLKIHNLECMEIDYLTRICKQLNIQDFEVFYYGKPKIWLNASSPYNNSFFRKLVWGVNMIIRHIPIKGRLISPHLIIKAKKN